MEVKMEIFKLIMQILGTLLLYALISTIAAFQILIDAYVVLL